MEKSKLGISINLFAALLYFLSAVALSPLVGVIAAGYVLLFEESIRLKKTAIKTLILTMFSCILVTVCSYLNIVSGFAMDTSNYILRIFVYCLMNAPYVMRILLFLIFGILSFRTFKGKEPKIKWIDTILDNHFFQEKL